jgi:hypothetical protein
VTERFGFAFARPYRPALAVLGIRPDTCEVRVTPDHLDVRFGRWRVSTPIDNVSDAQVAGPYRAYRAVGPRFSVADHGATFGTTAAGGACLCFHEPVAALLGQRLRHPNLTVTVADPVALVTAIEQARAGS